MTLKKLHNIIKSLVQANSNLKSFDSGTEKKQNNSNSKTYPQVYLERPILIECESLAPRGEFETFKFAVLYLDMPTSITDPDSIINSQSKMQQIANQCLVYMQNKLNLSLKQISKVTLENAFSDQVAGVRVEYELTDAIDIRDCELSEPTPAPTCNVVFDTINLSQTLTTLDIETIFSSIVGIEKFELSIRDSISAFTLIDTNLSPSLVNNFSYPLPPPETYFIRCIYYDLCGFQTEAPEFSIVIS